MVVMLHPDYPILPAADYAAREHGGFRSLRPRARLKDAERRSVAGGMPLYKFVANRISTAFQNKLLRRITLRISHWIPRLQQRTFARTAAGSQLGRFVFDNQVIAQCLLLKARIGEISCPTRYFAEASSINFRRSVRYGFRVLQTTFQCLLAKRGLRVSPRYRVTGFETAQPERMFAAQGQE